MLEWLVDFTPAVAQPLLDKIFLTPWYQISHVTEELKFSLNGWNMMMILKG